MIAMGRLSPEASGRLGAAAYQLQVAELALAHYSLSPGTRLLCSEDRG